MHAHGRVYDVTAYLPYHPAGARTIARFAGTDAAVHFDFHPKSARSVWAQCEIGRVQGAECTGCVVM